ncbi:MAG TPA: right-handed parallel beta-helix repeat-containing protein [Thermoanaerobaculia bacterium]|jgi:hypothetical protein
MRPLTLALLLLLPRFASAQTIEIIPPATIGEDLTATWTVVVTNPGDQPTEPQVLASAFEVTPGTSILSGVPAGCTNQSTVSYCFGFTLAPHERRELQYAVRYSSRFGTFFGVSELGAVRGRAKLVQSHEFVITGTADEGAGSLRQAILDMNAACTDDAEPCALVFRIDGPPPVEGWFTIRPLTPLPPVTAAFSIIDGRTQTRHSGDTNPAGPEVMIDGSALVSGHGLELAGKDAFLSDLAIGNFPGNGISGAPLYRTAIERCHLGVDPSGTGRAPNGSRGAQIEDGSISVTDSILSGNFRSGGWFVTGSELVLARNRFTDNGASGFYVKSFAGINNRPVAFDNVIANNAHAGISLDRASIGNYADNDFFGNLGRAIDIGIDGHTEAMVPGLPGRGGIIGTAVITAARYENGQTVIEARLAPLIPVTHLADFVYFYASPVPKDGGERIGMVDGRSSINRGPDNTYTLRVPRDLRGQWVSAGTFSIYIFNWDDQAPGTSEIGLPRLVE